QLSRTVLKHDELKAHSSTLDAAATLVEGVRAQASKDVASLDLGRFDEFMDAQPITATLAACQEIDAKIGTRISQLVPSPDEKRTVQVIDLLTRFSDSRQRFLTQRGEAIPV